jgi:hypothetical protein
LVERYSDPADRRIWRLRLTSAAAPLRREIKNFCAKLQRVATKSIEPAVLKTMAAGLRRMKENVGGRRLVDASLAKPSERPVERISTLARASRRHSA